ncbi:hypothetical protein NF865_05010 [Thermococcus aggregans]|uniref:Uncharacterized protein n=1 Tax=Thermococcus aggregans TaxID=110163 RepID=A0A9E7MZD7_THEAG|nr:hypothetical protein [Thermococcus aggregans]USS41526.1 hypothetical protein NF865_05010 [Thermococcus aggregans]
MKVEGAWPVTPSGPSIVLATLGFSLMIAGLILRDYAPELVFSAITLFVLSTGKSVEIKENMLILKYPFWSVKIPFEEIKEVMLANELKGVKLFRYAWKNAAFMILLFFIALIKAPWKEFPLLFLWIFVMYVVYFLYFFIPLYTIWENFGKIFLGIVLLLPIFCVLVGISPVVGIFLGITFLVFLIVYTRFDYIIVNTERRGVIVIGCPDGKKAIKLFRGVENETEGD